MRALLLILIVISAMVSPVTKVEAEELKDRELFTLLDEIWQYELSVSPFLASREGMDNYNHLLPDISPDARAAKHAQWQTFMDKLAAFDQDNLSTEAYISLLMQRYRLQNYLSEFNFDMHLTPINSEYGFHVSLASLPKMVILKTQKDYQDYLSRLNAMPDYFAQQISYMRQAIEQGYTQPKVVLNGFEASVQTYITDKPEDSVFFAPFNSLPNYFSEASKAALVSQAKATISQAVTPAYARFYEFLVSEYIPKSRESIAAKTWPNGDAYYADRVKHYTTTDMTAKQIHELGLSEVARIRAEMQKIVDSLKYEGTIDEFIQFLRTDPQFYATSPEALLKEASFIAKRMDAKLPSLFNYLPRTPYGVAPVPDSIAPKYTTGRYIGPSRDDQPGYYWVNTYALDKRPLYALPALTLHEAVPGHHLQISLAAELDDLPKVRQNTYISAFGEGWGLYSEFLGIEAGIYRNEYEHFGRLSYEMWRACRLVVDTGMHMFDWSRDKAIDYMMKNTALSEHNVKTEIDRYISWPAQALSYKIGEIKIKALRERAETALGEKFDVRAFHRAVLEHGSVPLFILEQQVEQYINSVKESH